MIPTNREVYFDKKTHKRHRMLPSLDDRVLDAFFLGLPGRCRRKTRCSAFNFDALCQRINEATHKKKWCCCNLPKQPLLELLAEAKSLRFWCLLLGLRLLALPPTTDSTKMCFFPMRFKCWLQKSSQKKKRNMSRNLERWPLPSIVYRLHPDISTGLRCSQDKCCVSPFLKSREMLEGTHDPNGTAFMAHRTTFALTTWQFVQVKESRIVTKQQKGHQSIDETYFCISKQPTSASMIRCWGCYASVPLLKGLASLPQHFGMSDLRCRIWVLKNRRLLFLAGTSGWWVLSKKTKHKKQSTTKHDQSKQIHFPQNSTPHCRERCLKRGVFPCLSFF